MHASWGDFGISGWSCTFSLLHCIQLFNPYKPTRYLYLPSHLYFWTLHFTTPSYAACRNPPLVQVRSQFAIQKCNVKYQVRNQVQQSHLFLGADISVPCSFFGAGIAVMSEEFSSVSRSDSGSREFPWSMASGSTTTIVSLASSIGAFDISSMADKVC